jgi:hypothetical protein
MHQPLATLYIGGYKFHERTTDGTGLPDVEGIRRHIGVDFRAAVGTPVFAPADSIVTASYQAPSGNQIIEILIGNLLWRFLHLSNRKVKAGDHIKEGQQIAFSGNSGGVVQHLHMDVRRNGTEWNASLSNYVDPMQFFPNVTTASAVKETKVMLTEIGLNLLYRVLMGEEPSQFGRDHYLGKVTLDEAYAAIKATPEYKQHVKDVKAARALVINHLPVDMR